MAASDIAASGDPLHGAPELFVLGAFGVRPLEGTLTRGGDVEHLEPKVMAVLVVLARNPGRVVTKQDLLAAVWPDTVVEEGALARAVSELRRALRDDVRAPRYIETIPKRGYRLLADVEWVPGAGGTVRSAAPRARRLTAVLAVVGVVAGGAGLVAWLAPWPPPASHATRTEGGDARRPMIVVLPFENLGRAEDADFAAGITEEITSRLASVPGLGVISRTTALRYRSTPRSIPQIGEEIGVDYVLEGTVRWQRQPEGIRVRITPQLIRVSDDTHVWARIYERDLVEIFPLQTELAVKVIEHVGAELLGPGPAALESSPTTDLDAYVAYLRALAVVEDLSHFDEAEMRRSLELLNRAVELDPRFARAHAELASRHASLYHFGYDRTEARLARALQAAETALELQPELPQAHLALGRYHYWGLRDYDRALEELAVAEQGLPNDADLLATIAFIRRRQGRYPEAVARLARAAELDPGSARLAWERGNTSRAIRDYAQAERHFDRAIALAPRQSLAYESKAWLLFMWRGDSHGARRLMEAAPDGVSPLSRARLEYLSRNPAAALEQLSAVPSAVTAEQHSVVPTELLKGWVHDARGERESARRAYQAARRQLEREVERRPDDHRAHSALGLAHAGLGEKEKAIEHGRRAVALLPRSRDAHAGPSPMAELARICAMVGEPEAALDLIETLLAIPAGNWMSPPLLEKDPRFDSLRDHARYRMIVGSGGATPY